MECPKSKKRQKGTAPEETTTQQKKTTRTKLNQTKASNISSCLKCQSSIKRVINSLFFSWTTISNEATYYTEEEEAKKKKYTL
jgi:hypothetical protein